MNHPKRRRRESQSSYERLEQRNLLTSVATPIEINQVSVEFGADNYIGTIAPFEDQVLLSGQDAVNGPELWLNDGTATGNSPLDVLPGLAGLKPRQITPFGDQFVFWGHDQHGYEPWITDGTVEGTHLIRDVSYQDRGAIMPDLTPFVVAGDKFFFTVTDDLTLSNTTYVSDGTELGTQVVESHFISGPDPSQRLTGRLGDSYVFTLYTDLWISDGTVAGTEVLFSDAIFHSMTVADGQAFLVVREFLSSTNNILVTDGTVGGTEIIRDDVAVRPDIEISHLNSEAFFFANGDSANRLWKSDGTADGTVVVSDTFSIGSTESAVLSNGQNDVLYLANSDGIYTTDGTVLTYQLAHIADTNPLSFFQVGTDLFYSRRDSDGYEPWFTDSSGTNSRQLQDINPTGDSNPRFILSNQGTTYFVTDAGSESALYLTDGTSAGTEQVVHETGATYGEYISDFTRIESASLGDKVYFVGSVNHQGTSSDVFGLWVTDGSQAGTELLQSGNSWIRNLTIYEGRVLFTTSAGLWETDGTVDGTVRIMESFFSFNDFDEANIHNGFLYFFAHDSDSAQSGLWKSDLTEGGTEFIQSLNISANSSFFQFTPSTTFFFMIRRGSGTFVELWKSNGTTDGTTKIFESDSTIHSRPHMAFRNGLLYFNVWMEDSGDEPWISDGTVAGTRLLKEIKDGESSSSPEGFTVLGDYVYFAARDDAVQLWRTDGTEAGTEIFFAASDVFGARPQSLTLWNGDLYFIGRETIDDVNVYRIDDTEAISLTESQQVDLFHDLTVLNDRIYFRAFTPETGYEPWSTDGTELGTQFLADINPGAFDSSPIFLGHNGSGAVFSASSDQHAFKFDRDLDDNQPIQDIFIFESVPLVVTNTNDSGEGSLREAILISNQTPGAQTIQFDLPADSIITPASQLPTLNDTVVIDGTTNPGFSGTPMINLNGALAGANRDGLRIAANNSIVSGLAIYNFGGEGIEVVNADNTQISGNYIGLSTLNQVNGNDSHGLRLNKSDYVQILDNVIADSGRDGIIIDRFSTNSLIQNNWIGVDQSGSVDAGNNGGGIHTLAGRNQILDNIIAGNGWHGIALNSNPAGENVIRGNRIGIGLDGTFLGNGASGLLALSDDNQIGGLEPGESNYIAANQLHGIIFKRADRNAIIGNQIGFNSLGESFGNQQGGIRVIGSADLIVRSNLVGGNAGAGIFLGGSLTARAQLTGNKVGTDATGNSVVSNSGIDLIVNSAPNAQINGNTFSAFSGAGIYTVGTSLNNSYQRNFVGVGADGITALADSIAMNVVGSGNMIGDFGEANTFNAARAGLVLRAGPNQVIENYFGTDSTLSSNFGGPRGINIAGGSSDNFFQENHFDNVEIAVANQSGGNGNYITNSFMYGGVDVGIDNGALGLNDNDVGDSDEGPNRMQNHPELLALDLDSGFLTIDYFVDTDPENGVYPLRIEFYLEGGNRVGLRQLASDTYMESDYQAGMKSYAFPSSSLSEGDRIVAIAIDGRGNTSEFGFSNEIQ